MKLELCYPLPPREFGPPRSYYPDLAKLPMLYYSWAIYPCSCGILTGWEVFHEDTVYRACSTECLEALAAKLAAVPSTPAPSVPSLPLPQDSTSLGEGSPNNTEEGPPKAV